MLPDLATGSVSIHSLRAVCSGPLCTALLLMAFLCAPDARGQSIYTVPAPPADGSSTGIRVANGTMDHAYHRAVTLIDGASLKLVPSGIKITRLGFVVNKGAGMKVSGNLTIYLSNVPTTVRDPNMNWSEIIGSMVKVYAGPFVIPDTTGPVDVMLSSPFQYSGRSIYCAYEFQSSGPFTTQNAVFASNITLATSTRSGFSSTEFPSVLSDVSDFRPVIRFGFPIPPMQWSAAASGTQKDLNALDIVDDTTAWACSFAGDVFRTGDAGKSWIGTGVVPDSTFAIFGITRDVAVTISGRASDASSVSLTTDGGGSWNKAIDPDLTASIAVAGKTSNRNIWCLGPASGDTVLFLNSSDWGASWTRSPSGVVLDPGVRISRGSGFRIGNVVWFGTRGSGVAADRVYKSSTGPGGPWKSYSTGRANVGTIAFSSANGTGIAAHIGCVDTVRRSTDGGITWTAVVASGLGEVSSLQYFAGGQDVWATTSTGIWRTTDDGLTWQRSFSTGSTSQVFSSLRFYPSYQIGLAIGSGGLIARGLWAVNLSTAISESSVQPTGYSLEANYPNPFNSSTWIEFSVPWQSFVTLKLIDVLGREVVTLVSGEKVTGRHIVEWNAGKNPSGVYFYRMVARPSSGVQAIEYTETHKLILLK